MKAEITKDYKHLLYECFATDPVLIEKWHIKAGSGLSTCVEKTLQDLIESKVEVFKVFNDSETMGYFGKELFDGKLFLTGFFIKPIYRNEEQRTLFWNLIQAEFNGPFYCGLYKRNKPAISFLKRQQANLVNEVTCPDGLALLFKVGA